MADIRIKDLPTTASLTASGDFIAIDGTSNGTRKLNAAAPAFLTSVTTPSLTSPASTNLTLGLGTGGTALTLTNSTLAATFAGDVTANGVIKAKDGSGNPYALLQADASAVGGGKTWTIASNATGSAIGTVGGLSIRDSSTGATVANFINTGLAITGDMTVSSTTAGSSGAGALVIAGGISAGNTGSAASYFGGAVTVGTGAAVGGATAGAGGLAFPAIDVAVANANTLDDYEEGTWTPTLSPVTSGTITVVSPNLCGYTKIGRVVTVNGLIEASLVSSPVGATVNVGGLPFPSNGNTNERSVGTVRAFSLTSGALNSTAIIASSTQTAVLYIDASLFQATSQFYIQLTYTV